MSVSALSMSSMESPTTAAAVAASSSSLSMSSGTLTFDLGSGTRSRWMAFSSESCIVTLASRHNMVIREGCMRAPVHRS